MKASSMSVGFFRLPAVLCMTCCGLLAGHSRTHAALTSAEVDVALGSPGLTWLEGPAVDSWGRPATSLWSVESTGPTLRWGGQPSSIDRQTMNTSLEGPALVAVSAAVNVPSRMSATASLVAEREGSQEILDRVGAYGGVWGGGNSKRLQIEVPAGTWTIRLLVSNSGAGGASFDSFTVTSLNPLEAALPKKLLFQESDPVDVSGGVVGLSGFQWSGLPPGILFNRALLRIQGVASEVMTEAGQWVPGEPLGAKVEEGRHHFVIEVPPTTPARLVRLKFAAVAPPAG